MNDASQDWNEQLVIADVNIEKSFLSQKEVLKLIRRKIFPELRRRGLSCSGFTCEYPEEQKWRMNSIMTREGTWGSIFWCHQYENDPDRYSVLYLAFRANDDGSESDEAVTNKQLEVAEELISVLELYDVPFHWNGKIEMCVVVGSWVGASFTLPPEDEIINLESREDEQLGVSQ
jgi:hypothetical protein